MMQFVLQHLMQQNDWTAPLLQPYAEQTIAIDFKVASALLTILSNGALAMAADTAIPNATLHLPPSLVMRLLRQSPDAHRLIKIDGDAALGMAVGKILAQMRWDVEQDLSQVVGDLAAYELIQLGQHRFAEWQTQGRTLAEMLREYLQEEQALLAKTPAISEFNRAVDQLREDTDRLQARLARLTTHLTPTESR